MWFNSGMSAFQPGDRVISKTNHQSLEEGGVYTVDSIHEQRTPFGTFVVYTVVRTVGGTQEVREVSNGHLLLEKAPSARYEGPCGSGWTGDRCTKRIGHKGRHSNE